MRRPVDLKRTLKYAATLVGYVFITLADGKFSPLSAALLVGNLGAGLNPLPSFFLYALPFCISADITPIWIGTTCGAVICAYFFIAGRYKRTPTFEIIPLTFISLIPFIAASPSYGYLEKTVISVTVSAFSVIMTAGARVMLIKGLRYRVKTDEFIAAATLFCAVGYGATVSLGSYAWQAAGLTITLYAAVILPKGFTAVVAAVSALPVCLYERSFSAMGIFLVCSLSAMIFSERSKILTSFSVVAVQVMLWLFTDVYPVKDPAYSLILLIPSVVFLFTPTKRLSRLKDAMALYKSDNLVRYSVNRNRSAVSGKLYEIAAVFDEMYGSMQKLGEKTVSKESITDNAAEDVLLSVCSVCPSFRKCRNRDFPSPEILKNAVSIGFAKGRLNLVDLPRSFSENCAYPESVTEKVNSLIKLFEREMDENEALESGRQLVLSETKGLSSVLKALAFSMSRQLEIRRDSEKKLLKKLFTEGIFATEALVFGDDSDVEINVTLPQKDVAKKAFLQSVEEVFGFPPAITAKADLTRDLSSVTLKRAPTFDAVFGIAATTKSDKQKSGDTHSVTKLSENKFLIALNDGMGSGEGAEDVSATAISLVETFYKAGLPSETVLSTVNKLLAFNRKDDFTAMDIGVIDLSSGGADFIKIGSPYSFVVTKDSVKIVEGNSLPLGILDEMRPTISRTTLSSGDVIVFMSDGVSDAFGSSGDLVGFLSSQRALNPKILADNILSRALALTGGEAKDDMTAFCVRIFKKVC